MEIAEAWDLGAGGVRCNIDEMDGIKSHTDELTTPTETCSIENDVGEPISICGMSKCNKRSRNRQTQVLASRDSLTKHTDTLTVETEMKPPINTQTDTLIICMDALSIVGGTNQYVLL